MTLNMTHDILFLQEEMIEIDSNAALFSKAHNRI